ncbi:leucine-rich repeat and immunoglobulin-like domain containing-NOGO receptor-interacting protein 4 [Ischnura elegans]|uniref:leucine-rich repeat and immunoglobulin-like domain containing-NOGO receptor-interacting protein 4 n=1 Tax=Ischnura elegans TaxID=197161 RepID=UPI001ED869E5|nr:leucine-rich repeat and immunoglobulin-like domain containing-NOGO receptor-interacting protein 4 [Ischnura elegans]XP_046402640.1 leucine-rich repeat and immunoglobulin-like domain containing-NOGO receptor-interacting protein 4 [Ischnura elegans]XP_046402641.1 leucine-rich repeat and immunoglobulin-like domain containing-NOGO receptor-interacting protein 4 [Ischnura elegans]XP_046402642.1 leucine-rich repeat and immunoglobulin-like domain containing-NOGO receptor-interacting protein 4 [Ischn
MAALKMLPVVLSLLQLASPSQAFCPSGCACDDQTLVASCVEANLDVVPITLNPSIRRLVLKHNKVRAVDAAFHFYGELAHADLSYNHLVSVPAGSFEAQRQLARLLLDHNRISALHNRTFAGLRSLSVLGLRGNFLEEVPAGPFAALPKLQELDLGGNRISRLAPNAFVGLPALRILQLDDNQLSSVPSPALAPLPALAELHLGLNALGPALPDDAFSALGRLSALDISGAELTSLGENSFRGLNQALRRLSLADNRLSSVPTGPLSLLGRLEELSLGQNDFQEIGSKALKGLTNLRVLDLSGSRELTVVAPDAFSENLNLEAIAMNANRRLTELGEGVFVGLPRLRRLSLRGNSLREVPRTLAAWGALRSVDVSENPLECGCGVRWLRDMLARHPEAGSLGVDEASEDVVGGIGGEALCDAPSTVRGRALRALSDEEMGCAVAWDSTQKQAVIGAICAVVLVLIITLVVLLYRYRRRVQDALKDYRWNNRAISRKEHEYQKTFGDEDYVIRAPQQHHNNHILPPNHLHGLGAPIAPPPHLSGGTAFRPSGMVPPPPALKPIPVTEL